MYPNLQCTSIACIQVAALKFSSTLSHVKCKTLTVATGCSTCKHDSVLCYKIAKLFHNTLLSMCVLCYRGSGVVKRRHPSPAAVARMGQRRDIMGRKAYQPSPSDRRSGQSRRGVVYHNTASSRSPSPGCVCVCVCGHYKPTGVFWLHIGGRARFDPSAYVESRRKRQQEIASKIK